MGKGLFYPAARIFYSLTLSKTSDFRTLSPNHSWQDEIPNKLVPSNKWIQDIHQRIEVLSANKYMKHNHIYTIHTRKKCFQSVPRQCHSRNWSSSLEQQWLRSSTMTIKGDIRPISWGKTCISGHPQKLANWLTSEVPHARCFALGKSESAHSKGSVPAPCWESKDLRGDERDTSSCIYFFTSLSCALLPMNAKATLLRCTFSQSHESGRFIHFAYLKPGLMNPAPFFPLITRIRSCQV